MNKPPPVAGSAAAIASERSTRSVFVGNISYEIGEEMLKQVFSQVGTVVHFRLVLDRETGKPKGYGFCEYADEQTAQLAIRNLNGYELSGRALRVDSAAGGERSADEVAQLQLALGQRQDESPYGPEPTEGKAPEAISRSVSSLPPEKMFELMKQMKDVCRSNPQEAKKMLVDNPQLAYALLQAQVVMRIVDPQVAMAMLHREAPPSQPPFSQGTAVSAGNNGGSPASFPPTSSSGPTSFPAPPAPAQPQEDEDNQQAQLLVQVLQLREEEIALLPPGDRERVIELRNQLRQQI